MCSFFSDLGLCQCRDPQQRRIERSLVLLRKELQIGVGVVPPEVQARRKDALLLWFQRRSVRLAHIVHRLRSSPMGPEKKKRTESSVSASGILDKERTRDEAKSE